VTAQQPPPQGQPDPQQAGQGMPPGAGPNGQKAGEPVRVPMLADEEQTSPLVAAQRSLTAIDILRHGVQPADIARTLAMLSRGLLLWDPKYGEWLAWTGTHWNTSEAGWEDEHRQARRLRDSSRRVAVFVHDGLDDSANCLVPEPPPKSDGTQMSEEEKLDYQRGEVKARLAEVVKKLSTKSMQRDVLGQVSSHHGIMAYLDDYPGRRNVLNFTNGTVALDSEAWWVHNPADLVTHCLPYAWDPSAQCPWFRWLVWRMTGRSDDHSTGHTELYEYVLAVLGYCLIYGNPAQLVFFLTGETKTGKTTVIEIVTALLGALAHKSKPVLITVPRSGDQHDSVRWSIRGKRLVYVDETKGVMRIDVAALKDLSGGRTMSVRKMRASSEVQSPITFTIVIPTNDMPSMLGGDSAVAERLVKIPCGGETVPVAERDPALADKIIAAEAPGILALLVYYARRYYREGLPRPAVVTTASQEYMESQNSVAVFQEERCTSEPLPGKAVAQVERSGLFGAYTSWCGGPQHLGRNEFYDEVRKLPGVKEAKDGRGVMVFTGIRLQTPEDTSGSGWAALQNPSGG
jgi:P4 family phage/plasmid primase-like protien